MSKSGRTVIVTGAGGFIGGRLVQRLLADASFAADHLVVCDRTLPERPASDRVRAVQGDVGDAAVLPDLLRDGADIVFHLAGVLGGAAEADPFLARRVNIDATLSLMEALRGLPAPARLVFASSIAVFGPTDRSLIDDATVPNPVLLYGAQKRMIEVAIEQAAARGWIDGLALRLPGIVARPGTNGGLKSAFLNDQFNAWLKGRDIVLPVSAEGTTWLLSVSACVEALIQAAGLASDHLGPVRAFTLPALHVEFRGVVEAMRRVVPDSPTALTFQPDPDIQAQFGRQPRLETILANDLGFRHDGDLDTLVRRAFEELIP